MPEPTRLMSGPATALTSVDAVRQTILAAVTALPARMMTLADAEDCVLAADVAAHMPMPPFTSSAMDGYAVRASDTALASLDRPVGLPVQGTIAAGDPQPEMPNAASCWRIMTGAPLPAGADAVVPFEDVSAVSEIKHAGATISLTRVVKAGAHVRHAGSDVERGAIIAQVGEHVDWRRIAVLTAAGHARLPVVPRPRLAIISTGDELAGASASLQLMQVPDVNGPMLAAAGRAAGGASVVQVAVGDDPAVLLRALTDLPPVDLIITSGGVSAGDYDPLRAAFTRELAMRFWSVAMRPGRPLGFGRWRGTPLLALPGNPVAAAVSFTVFARPLLAKLAGRDPAPRSIQVRVQSAIPAAGERRSFVRARLTHDRAGIPLAWPAPDQRVSRISDLATTDALVIVPEHASGFAAGDEAEAILLRADPDWVALLLRSTEQGDPTR